MHLAAPSMRLPRDPAKAALFALCLLPFFNLLWLVLAGGLGANPIRAATDYTGLWAIRFLVLALAVTPLMRLTGWKRVMRFRRMIGLFAFFHAAQHMLIYFVLDHFFYWETIAKDLTKRSFVIIGMAVFVILLLLAATSTNAMIRRLGGRRWRNLHRLVYLAGIGAAIHFTMAAKADRTEPLIYLAIILALLLMRLLPARASARRRRPVASELSP